MNFIKVPNLPLCCVKAVVIDSRVDPGIVNGLKNLRVELIKTRKFSGVYNAISFHPDIVMHHIGGAEIVYAPGVDCEFLSTLRNYGFEMIEGKTILSNRYPGNIAYNAARVGNYVIHNLRYTDPVLRNELEKIGVDFIDVKQGYSKCSICILNENCIITSDKGIAKAVERKGIEVLLLEEYENIVLPGLDKGFIGGSTGLINRNTLAVSGNIEKLRSADKFKKFLSSKGIEVVCLSDDQILDIGSIIPLLSF